ncbi:MAG TPA: hypothetical protein VNA21_06835, partial [Steroidobacteraceae bacterium]|nr:hypothetical protein [Steroidobacteraceae bacterium]
VGFDCDAGVGVARDAGVWFGCAAGVGVERAAGLAPAPWFAPVPLPVPDPVDWATATLQHKVIAAARRFLELRIFAPTSTTAEVTAAV